MKRRNLIKTIAAGSAIAGVGGYIWVKTSDASEIYTLDYALSLLEDFSKQHLKATGNWSLSEIYQHCAQSIHFSMQGFPEHKSEVFKSTIGSAAFGVFKAKGSMNHGLSEAIPGAAALDPTMAETTALSQLKQAFIDFKAFQGELKEHFAYGELSKREYEIAHLLHLLNHAQEIEPVS